MKKLSIALDPHLTEQFGPEIHWTWRLLLTGIGWTWQEVPLVADCDVAFVTEPARAPAARLCIVANSAAWKEPGSLRLEALNSCEDFCHPIFEGEKVARTPVQLEEGRLICVRDLVFDVFWLATGQEERYLPQGKHGFFYLTGTLALHEKIFLRALASEIMGWLEKTLRQLGQPPPKPRWPQSKLAAAAVGHDVDYPEVKRWLEPLRIVKRNGTRGIVPSLEVLVGKRQHWHFSSWVEMEKRLQTRSTFFFVARQGSLFEYVTGTPDPFYDVTSKKFRQLFRYLNEEGFEVGLHASYLAYQSQEKFAAEKQRLEEASKQPIVGNRHHYWHLNPNDPEETLWIHEQIGLTYDSSLIHRNYLGWRRGLSQPFFPFHQAERRELKTLQIPTVWMDNQLFGMRKNTAEDRLTILRNLAARAAHQGGCLFIDIHDYVFDDSLFPGWALIYQQLWGHLLNRGDFWFATAAEIAAHFSKRYSTILEASHGIDKGIVRSVSNPASFGQ